MHFNLIKEIHVLVLQSFDIIYSNDLVTENV